MEGLRLLMESVRGDATVTIVHNENDSTFHPKLYLFEGARSDLVVGSGNLTSGGLFTNYEASLHLDLHTGDPAVMDLLDQVRDLLRGWTTPTGELVKILTPELLDQLVRMGYVISEADARERRGSKPPVADAGEDPAYNELFARLPVPSAPRLLRPAARTIRERGPGYGEPRPRGRRGFVMTLKQTDAGSGQVTPGTSRRSPEIFIPLAARDFDPAFWGWDADFTEDPGKAGKFDRHGVRMRLGTETVDVNMMTWPDKHDFRLRSESLRSAGHPGDILRLEKTEGGVGYDYYAEVIPQGTALYNTFERLCTNAVRNSDRRWGYYDADG
jgi:hypothetical protein